MRGGLREKERVGDSVSILDFGEYREFLGSEVRSKKKHQKKSRFERLSYITVPFVALCTLAHSSRFSLAHRLSAHCARARAQSASRAESGEPGERRSEL